MSRSINLLMVAPVAVACSSTTQVEETPEAVGQTSQSLTQCSTTLPDVGLYQVQVRRTASTLAAVREQLVAAGTPSASEPQFTYIYDRLQSTLGRTGRLRYTNPTSALTDLRDLQELRYDPTGWGRLSAAIIRERADELISSGW